MAHKEPRFCAFSDVGKPPRPQCFLPLFRSSNSPGNTQGAAVEKLPCKLHEAHSLHWACCLLPPTCTGACPVYRPEANLGGGRLATPLGRCSRGRWLRAPAGCSVPPRLSWLHKMPDSFPAWPRVNSPGLQTPRLAHQTRNPLVFPVHLLSRCSYPKGQPPVLLPQTE